MSAIAKIPDAAMEGNAQKAATALVNRWQFATHGLSARLAHTKLQEMLATELEIQMRQAYTEGAKAQRDLKA